MFFKRCLVIICGLLAYTTSTTHAQWEAGGGVGIGLYFGDLNTFFVPRAPGPAVHFLARRNFDGRICLRGGFSYVNIGASDANSPNEWAQLRNLSFRSHVFEGSFVMEFNFTDFHSTYNNRDDKPISPYVLGGLSVFYHNPRAQWGNGWARLQPLGTEGQAPGEEYRLLQPAVLIGGGIKADLNHSWSLNMEICHRMTFTDYLDDVSGTYADTRLIEGYRGSLSNMAVALADRSTELPDNDIPIGEVGRQRGDSKHRDAFMSISIGLVYRFTSVTCPAYN